MRGFWFTVEFLFPGAASAFAAEVDRHYDSQTGAEAKTAGSPTMPQETWPVTGKPIRQDRFVEQDSTKVYFRCPTPISKLKESPMKYVPSFYRQFYPQSVQVRCPVTGGPLNGKTFTVYQGRQIRFCCDGCPAKFMADPAKYLANRKQWSTDQVHCPVTGTAIDPLVSAEYEGKTVYFSGQDARTRFEVDPAKYAAALRPEAGIVARGLTADDDLILSLTSPRDASIYKRRELEPMAYEGKTYFLLGDDGVRRFQADPAGYAKALHVRVKRSLATQKALTPDTEFWCYEPSGARPAGCAPAGESCTTCAAT